MCDRHSDRTVDRRRFLKGVLLASACAGLSAAAAACADKDAVPAPTANAAIESPTPELHATSEEIWETEPMIWYVDIEHEAALADPQRAPNFDSVRKQRAQVCGHAAGVECEAILYQDVSRELAEAQNIRAIAISGNTTDWAAYDVDTFEPLAQLVKSGDYPVIGLCGGHQLIGLFYDAACGAMRKLEAGEEDKGGFAPGWFKEVGYMPVRVVQDDPVFQDLGNEPVFYASHYWEIKELPPEFELLASSDDCEIQVMKHKDHLIYGTQFHPEVNSAEHRDGFRLLRNFFTLAGIWKG